MEQILPILDTLEMAATAPCADENYKKGVEMTLNKAADALAKLKVEEIQAQDQPFDPNLMSAVQQVPAQEGQESGAVVQQCTRKDTGWAKRLSGMPPWWWPNRPKAPRSRNIREISPI